MLMEFLVPNLNIVLMTNMTEDDMLQKRSEELVKLEEDRYVTGFDQQIQKRRQKAWRDRHIRRNEFHPRALVLMYNRKFMQHPGKLQMYWLGPLVI